MLELANVKPLILDGLRAGNEHKIIVFSILKRASTSRRIVVLRKTGPAASREFDLCMYADGRWVVPLDFVASTNASCITVVKLSWFALPSDWSECEENLRTAEGTERLERNKEGVWTKTKKGAGR